VFDTQFRLCRSISHPFAHYFQEKKLIILHGFHKLSISSYVKKFNFGGFVRTVNTV
jgi:hypothetical protein